MGVEVSSQRSTQPQHPRRPQKYRVDEKPKYWVDEKSKKNCFMVYPKALTITWADSAKDTCYWRWTSVEDSSGIIDAAELLNVCWLDVQGKVDSTKLSSGTLYEVVFIVRLKQAADGWEIPVNFRLTLPDGSKPERKADDLNKIPREEWKEIPAGEFTVSPGLLGNIEFSMYEHESGQWKSGLLIKGVAVRPKNKEGENNSTASVWPTSRWSLKTDLQALSNAASITRPIFDGLPKPITGRWKTALD